MKKMFNCRVNLDDRTPPLQFTVKAEAYNLFT